jgi:Flp pilus assembly protein TadD
MTVITRSKSDRRPWLVMVRAGFIAATALSLGACQTTGSSLLSSKPQQDLTTASLGNVSIKETAAAGKRWKADKKNVNAGLDYAARLKALGQTSDQMQVLDELTKLNPQNTELQVMYGKELILAGQSRRGQHILEQVVKSGKADWKTYSALGSALDQQGKHAQARGYYEAALKSRPGEISILNNMAMSYMLDGDLVKAEQLFKQLDAMPNSGQHPRIRQNLALTVGLQGRFDEARDIASRDLPPDKVEANLVFLKTMLAQQNTWQKLQSGGAQPTSG